MRHLTKGFVTDTQRRLNGRNALPPSALEQSPDVDAPVGAVTVGRLPEELVRDYIYVQECEARLQRQCARNDQLVDLLRYNADVLGQQPSRNDLKALAEHQRQHEVFKHLQTGFALDFHFWVVEQALENPDLEKVADLSELMICDNWVVVARAKRVDELVAVRQAVEGLTQFAGLAMLASGMGGRYGRDSRPPRHEPWQWRRA